MGRQRNRQTVRRQKVVRAPPAPSADLSEPNVVWIGPTPPTFKNWREKFWWEWGPSLGYGIAVTMGVWIPAPGVLAAVAVNNLLQEWTPSWLRLVVAVLIGVSVTALWIRRLWFTLGRKQRLAWYASLPLIAWGAALLGHTIVFR